MELTFDVPGRFVPIEHPSGLRAELYYSGRDDSPPLLYLHLSDGCCLVRLENGIEENVFDLPPHVECSFDGDAH